MTPETIMLKGELPLYFPHREKLQAGDLLQWRSETPLGWAIRFARKVRTAIGALWHLKWVWPEIRDNHSSWVVKEPYHQDTSRRYHCESVSRGLTLRILSDRLMEHKGKVWWHPLLAGHSHARDCMSRWGYDNQDLGYDFLSIFKQIYRGVKVGTSRVFCSESVCAVVRDCGLTENKKALPPDMMLGLGLWQKKGVRIK